MDSRFILKINRRTLLFIIMLILTVSGSTYMYNNGLQALLEYVGYGLLLIFVFISYLKLPLWYRKKYINKQATIILLLFSVGLLLQDLKVGTKVTLLFTMVAIVFSSLVAENFIKDWKDLRILSFGILIGVAISAILAAVSGIDMIDSTNDTKVVLGLTFGFNGGIRFKNYFGADMVAVFIGLYIFRKSTGVKIKIDTFLMALSVILIFLSASRGAYAIFIVFIVAFQYKELNKIKKERRHVFILIAGGLLLLLFIFLFKNVALRSDTYMYRIRGLINYLDYYKGDIFHMVFGNAETVYDQELSYVETVRSIVGWDGSLEFSWLDILIKNGLIGIIGYFLVFVRVLRTASQSKEWLVKTVCIAIVACALVSSLVETYIQSVHAVFGIYCYLLMATMCGFIHKEKADDRNFVRNLSI